MKQYKVRVKTETVGSECEDVLYMPDDATEEEIEEMAREVAFEMVEWSYQRVKTRNDYK